MMDFNLKFLSQYGKQGVIHGKVLILSILHGMRICYLETNLNQNEIQKVV